MDKNFQENLIKEFRRKWDFAFQGGAFNKENIPKIRENVEDFWLSKLKSQRSDLLKKVEKEEKIFRMRIIKKIHECDPRNMGQDKKYWNEYLTLGIDIFEDIKKLINEP